MAQEKYLKITTWGSGTREEVATALEELAKEVRALTDKEIEKGADLGDGIFSTEIDESNEEGI